MSNEIVKTKEKAKTKKELLFIIKDEKAGLTARKQALNSFLQRTPRPEDIAKHPFAKDKYGKPLNYIPISRVEMLMDMVFQFWRAEVKSVQIVYNAVAVTVRLHYLDPTSNEWTFHDGVGAVDVQTKKDCSPSDMAMIVSSAVMKALPAAKSYAIKDAAGNIGKIFGRDLNRELSENYIEIFEVHTEYENDTE